MFNPALFDVSDAHRRVYRRYELAYTVNDVVAALAFVVGSVFFFSPALTYAGTWLFLIGSCCFGLRPTIRLLRELHLSRLPLPGDPP